VPISTGAPLTDVGNVVGVGVDLVHVPGLAEQLARPGTRFAAVFTPGERADLLAGDGHPRRAAARWAAKEALVKAWSAMFFGEPPVMGEEALGQIETVSDGWGRPALRLHGEVARHLRDHDAHLSLSHDGDYAIAYVVLSAARR
jgi:holo-[acyl-carrier protein] synthase